MRQIHRNYDEFHGNVSFSKRYIRWPGLHPLGCITIPKPFDQNLETRHPSTPLQSTSWVRRVIVYRVILSHILTEVWKFYRHSLFNVTRFYMEVGTLCLSNRFMSYMITTFIVFPINTVMTSTPRECWLPAHNTCAKMTEKRKTR